MSVRYSAVKCIWITQWVDCSEEKLWEVLMWRFCLPLHVAVVTSCFEETADHMKTNLIIFRNDEACLSFSFPTCKLLTDNRFFFKKASVAVSALFSVLIGFVCLFSPMSTTGVALPQTAALALAVSVVPLHDFVVFLYPLFDVRQFALQILAALLLFQESRVLQQKHESQGD